MSKNDNFIQIGNDCCLWIYDGCEKPYTVCDIVGNKAEMTDDEFNRLALESSLVIEMIDFISNNHLYGNDFSDNKCINCNVDIDESEHRDDCDYQKLMSKISKLRERNHD